jgi:hypothetical protein
VAYALLGSPLPQRARAWLASRAGPRAPALASRGLHVGLGLVMALALFAPLLLAADPDYPARSRYATLFESLGRSRNAPIVQAMYRAVQHLGPAGYAVIAAIILAAGGLLGWVGLAFAKLKDRLFDELGVIKYSIVIGLFLMMMGVLAKIVLRLLFGIKYLFSLPGFNFNI